MNVEYSNGFGAERSTDMDSGDSLLGVKGLENLSDGLRLAYFITVAVDSEGKDAASAGYIQDASVAVNSRTYGTITLGLFKSFMRLQSDRTVNIFEAGGRTSNNV
jgi:predicted porin